MVHNDTTEDPGRITVVAEEEANGITTADDTIRIKNNKTNAAESSALAETPSQMASGGSSLMEPSGKNQNRSTQASVPKAKLSVTNAAPRGSRNLNVPMTNVVLCVSKKDIICTASLTSQLVCLAVTLLLAASSFSYGRGQIMSLDNNVNNAYSFELAMIINTIIDPMVCVIFSSNFRKAARVIRNKIVNSIASICKPSDNSAEQNVSTIELGAIPKQN